MEKKKESSNKEKKGLMSTWWFNFTLAACIALFLVYGSMLFLHVITKHNKEYSVPDFRGMTVSQAAEVAEDAHVNITVVDSVFSQKNRGKVRSHVPQAGSMVKKGRRILLTVNAVGIQKVEMPNLVGYSLRQALAELSQRGLTMGRIIYKADMASNNVLRQMYRGSTIAPGTKVNAEAVIDLVVGLNSKDNVTKVPDLIGQNAQNAVIAIHDNYLNVKNVVYDESVVSYQDSLTAVVYKQSLRAGNHVIMGNDITIHLKVQTEEEKDEKK